MNKAVKTIARILLAILMVVVLIILFTSCSSAQYVDEHAENYYTYVKDKPEATFKYIYSGNIGEGILVYNVKSGVMYSLSRSGYIMTPLYNADGSLMIYSEHMDAIEVGK